MNANNSFERNITRIKYLDDSPEYCTITIKLNDGRLSITGEAGYVVSPTTAKTQALEYWQSFFEDSPAEIILMNERQGTNFHAAKAAAEYVLSVDGPYHGIDAKEVGESVHVMYSCGRIHDTLVEFFPEAKPLIPWHLNDMKASCEHQEKLGWKRGKHIALTADTLTKAQRKTIDGDLLRVCEDRRNKAFEQRWAIIRTGGFEGKKFLTEYKTFKGESGPITLYDMDTLTSSWSLGTFRGKQYQQFLRDQIEKEITPEVFEARIYENCLSAPCPECGYKYGTEWLKRELPAEIIQLAQTVCED